MNKIVIFGSPGVGKTTFAQKLGNELGIEVIHLDRHFWQPNWVEFSRARRIEIEQELIKGKDHWIIEGTFLSSSDSRLQAADTIIFLDMPFYLCLEQAVIRYNRFKGQEHPNRTLRPDMPDGCKEKLGWFYVLKILGFPYKGRKSFLKKMKQIQANALKRGEEKNFHICHSHQSSAALLQAILDFKRKVASEQRQEDSAMEEEAAEALSDQRLKVPVPVS